MIYKLGGSVKDVDTTGRVVTGFYSSTGTLDTDNDIFEKGAFQKTLKEWGPQGKNRIWHLFQHDHFSPVNKPRLLKEEDGGAYFETKMPATDLGQMLLTLYQEGAITEHSVAIEVTKSADQKGSDARIIKEVRMWEGSSVLWGANENTPAMGLKSEDVQARVSIIEKLLRDGTFEKDQIYQLLQLELIRLKKALEPEQLRPPLKPRNMPPLNNIKIKLS